MRQSKATNGQTNIIIIIIITRTKTETLQQKRDEQEGEGEEGMRTHPLANWCGSNPCIVAESRGLTRVIRQDDKQRAGGERGSAEGEGKG